LSFLFQCSRYPHFYGKRGESEKKSLNCLKCLRLTCIQLGLMSRFQAVEGKAHVSLCLVASLIVRCMYTKLILNLKVDGSVLEAMAASGIRSVRYAKELSKVSQVHSNDLSEIAVECIKRNSEINNVTTKIVPTCMDCW